MKDIALIIIGLILFGIVWGLWSYVTSRSPTVEMTPPDIACTADAKICPDGSVVGRSGPLCEFAPCPE